MRRAVAWTLAAIGCLTGGARAESPPGEVTDRVPEIIATVHRFDAALQAGDFERMAVELAPDLIVFESGSAERSAEEYLSGHAKADAEFLKTAKSTQCRRSAYASEDTAWVVSECELRVEKDGKPAVIDSTETMVLRSTDAGWKIVHIHWSSRPRKQ